MNMKNKVKFGLSNVHVAPIISQTKEGIEYGDIFQIPGAVNLTLDPEGEEANFSADNNPKYFKEYANQGYSGSLEIALIVDAFRTQILGLSQDANGAFIENENDTIKDFALGFQIDGDVSNRKYWFYSVSAQRPSTASQTIETSKTPVTDTLNITASPRLHDKSVKVDLELSENNKTAYDGFFDSVYEKTASV